MHYFPDDNYRFVVEPEICIRTLTNYLSRRQIQELNNQNISPEIIITESHGEPAMPGEDKTRSTVVNIDLLVFFF